MADKIQQSADLIRNAYDGNSIAPVRDILNPDGNDISDELLQNAYGVQSANTDIFLKQGRRLVGRKIGLTSKVVQKQLGVDQPDFGMLFADMAYGENEDIPFGNFIAPKAEAEIAVILDKDLSQAKNTYADVLNAIDYVSPSVEIVDSRIADWNINILDTIADNASSGGFVLGTQKVSPKRVDWNLCGMVMERRGEQVSLGAGLACLGNPLNAIGWLADKMVEIGKPLQAGDVVLTGALGPMVPVAAGDVFSVRINGLGSVNVMFSEN